MTISEQNGLDSMGASDLLVLSIGVSTAGAAEAAMLENNKDRKVIATTIDRKGLETVASAIPDQLKDRIKLKLEDVRNKLTYDSDSIDFIYARLVLHYLTKSEVKSVLIELHRVLSKGKKLYIVVRSTECEEIDLPGTYVDQVSGFTHYPDYRTLENQEPVFIARRFYTKASLSEEVGAAGFTVESIKQYDEELSSDFARKNLVPFRNNLIEVIAVK